MGRTATVERQLAEQRPWPSGGPDLPRRREDADGDREVVGSTALAPIGWREVDRDPREWIFVAGVPDGAADSLARLRERRIR